MAVYAIGDVQGCLTSLQALLKKVRFSPKKDRLWFVGDLVNRGPESLETLRFIKSLSESSTIVLGNHDLGLLASAYCQRPSSKGDTIEPILQAPDCEALLTWLRQQKLLHRDRKLGYSMVHAGLPPQWSLKEARGYAKEVQKVLRSNQYQTFLSQLYGDEPEIWSPQLTGIERLRFIVNCLTRLRYCKQNGALALKCKGSPNMQKDKTIVPWFDMKGRRSATDRIIFGHWSTLGLYQKNQAYCIDSGCVWGRKLTAMRLDQTQPTFIQVKSKMTSGANVSSIR